MGLKGRRLIAAGGVGAAIVLAAGGMPAQAASEMSADMSMSVTATTTTAVVWAQLPMNRYDAQGYIDNGARIELRCYGDDQWFDNQLFPTRTYTRDTGANPGSADRLLAGDSGVYLVTSITYARGAEFNEDTLPNGDEVYCKARWIDGDGQVLERRTPIQYGTF